MKQTKWYLLKTILLMLLSTIHASTNKAWCFQQTKIDFFWKTATTVDSTRKDYNEIIYNDDIYAPVGVVRSYDKTFVSSINDLKLSFKGDLSDKQFLDITEILHYQKYHPEDYKSHALDIYKYTYTDHLLNVSYGFSLGNDDLIKLDYINNIYRIPIDSLSEYVSNKGKVQFNHRVNNNTSIGFEGTFEDRNYSNDPTSDYQEGAGIIEFSKFFPEKIRYKPISTALRGDKSTFTNSPNAMAAKRVIDYYTNWTTNPNEKDAEAKFIPMVVRGDLHLNITGDFRRRVRSNLKNPYKNYSIESISYDQPSLDLKILYDANEQLELSMGNYYYIREHNRQDNLSSYYYLFDHKYNKFSVSATYKPSLKFVHILSGSHEFYIYSNQKEQDYKLNSFSWETYYSANKHNASLYIKSMLLRYKQPRLYYPDNNQFHAITTYDYSLTPKWIFHLKNEWIDYDYKIFEDLFYSSYIRNTWKVSFEHLLDRKNSLEIGFQNKDEKHQIYTVNNVIEKTTFLTWYSQF